MTDYFPFLAVLFTLLIGIFFGGSGLWLRVKAALRNLGDLIGELADAIADDNITVEELKAILAKLQLFFAELFSIKRILFK